jgi:hypothetical protein
VPISHRYTWMSDVLTAAIRLRWPRHTAKHIANRYGRAVITAKCWLRDGIPPYQFHTILADLDTELEAMERELTAVREGLRRAREQQGQVPYRGAGASRGESAASRHPVAPP